MLHTKGNIKLSEVTAVLCQVYSRGGAVANKDKQVFMGDGGGGGGDQDDEEGSENEHEAHLADAPDQAAYVDSTGTVLATFQEARRLFPRHSTGQGV